MLYKRTFWCTKTISDSAIIYSDRTEKHKKLLLKLKSDYEKRCHKNMYIENVVRIIQCSDFVASFTNNEGEFSISIEVEVECIIFDKDEIVHGCKVINKQSNYLMVLSSDKVSVNFTEDVIKAQSIQLMPLLNKIVQGWSIPIMIVQSRYPINQETVTCIAVPYYPKVSENFYFHINKGLSKEDSANIDDFLSEIDDELKLHKEFDKNKYDAFVKLMYPFKNNIVPTGKALDLKKENFNLIDVIVYLPSSANRINKKFYKVDKLPEDVSFLNASAYTVFRNFLTDTLKYLIALRGFMTQYQTPESFKALDSYWKEFHKLKLDEEL